MIESRDWKAREPITGRVLDQLDQFFLIQMEDSGLGHLQGKDRDFFDYL